MDLEPESKRPRYALCRAGLVLNAVGIGLLCADSLIILLAILLRSIDLLNLRMSVGWVWVVGAPITWTTLLGAYLLWGRWTDAAWQRRAGLLLLLNTIDLVFWAIHHNKELGLRLGDVGHVWLREQLAMGFGWAEFLLLGSLATEVAVHLGSDVATALGDRVRALSASGAVLWGVVFLAETNWAKGWPLQANQATEATQLALLISIVLTTLTTLNLAIVCIVAARRCGQYLAILKSDGPGDDLLVSRSETETEADNRWDHQGKGPWA